MFVSSPGGADAAGSAVGSGTVTIDAAAASLRAFRDTLPPLSRSSEIGRLVASLAAFAAAPPPPFIGAPLPHATADTIAAVASAASLILSGVAFGELMIALPILPIKR